MRENRTYGLKGGIWKRAGAKRWYRAIIYQCGHFWQNRFFSCPLGERHRWLALAYAERNPVRAGIVSDAWRYQWSSARAHLQGTDPRGLLKLGEWEKVYTPSRWQDVLQRSMAEEDDLEHLREATRSGRPFGEQAFTEELAERLGRDLTPGRPGRPAYARAASKYPWASSGLVSRALRQQVRASSSWPSSFSTWPRFSRASAKVGRSVMASR